MPNKTTGYGNADYGKAIRRSKEKSAKLAKRRYKDAVEAQQQLYEEEERKRLEAHENSARLKSIWDSSNLDQFLQIADDREQGFQAERDVHVVMHGGEKKIVVKDRVAPQSDNRDWFALSEQLPIPRRPEWSYDTRPEELQLREKVMFLDWRRQLAMLEEKYKVTLTPYEKNLEVWRQLWRVVERSDVVVMILDARNPLAFRCKDFEDYVTAHKTASGVLKRHVLLLNKADLLTDEQRRVWAEYLTLRGFRFFFFSAAPLTPEQEAKIKGEVQSEGHPKHDDDEGDRSGDDEEDEEEEEENEEEEEAVPEEPSGGGKGTVNAQSIRAVNLAPFAVGCLIVYFIVPRAVLRLLRCHGEHAEAGRTPGPLLLLLLRG